MGKGFMLAKEKKDVYYTKEYYLDEDKYDLIELLIRKNRTSCPLLWDLFGDEYGEDKIDFIHLEDLKDEIAFLKKKTKHRIISIGLNKLHNLCERGIKEKLDLYGMGD